MSAYIILKELLLSAPSLQFEDEVIDTAIRIAQVKKSEKVKNQVINFINKQRQLINNLLAENQTLKNNIISLEGSTVPAGIKLEQSGNLAGVTNVETQKPVNVKKQNLQPFNNATISPSGVTLEAPGNIQ